MSDSAQVSPVGLNDIKARNDKAARSDEGSFQAYEASPAELEDAVFGEIGSGGPNYKNVGWMAATVIMVKTQVGLGVLSLPATFATLGLVPGCIVLTVIAVLWTYGAYVLGQFKLRHPEAYSIADVGEIVLGKPGRYLCSAIYWLWMTTVAGSALLSISIALNAVSLHATCTAVFVVVATIAVFLLASIQTLEEVAWITWAGALSLVASLLIVTIGVAVADRPAEAPATGPWDKDLHVFYNPTFLAAMSAVGQLSFAFAGTPAYISIMSEMRNPKMYTRALLACQGFTLALYLSIGVVVYYYCGQYVATPALGSAGATTKRVAYGIALPALLVSGILYTHVPAKWIFLQALKGSKHLTKNTPTHWGVWFACVAGCAIFSYIIASAIPVFSGLVGLIGALFGTFLCTILTSTIWFYDNWADRKINKSLSYKLLVVLNVVILAIGAFIVVAGTYGSVVDIQIGYAADGGTSPWSCADNSNSS